MLQEVMQRYTSIVVNGKSRPVLPTSLVSTIPPPSNAELLSSIMQTPPPLLLPSAPLPSASSLNIPLPDPLAGDLDDIFLQPISQSNQAPKHFGNSAANDLLLMHSPANLSETLLSPNGVDRSADNLLLQPKVIGKVVPLKL